MTLNLVPTPEQATSPLIETSLADAIAAIEGTDALSPARWTGLRIPVARLHHAPLQLTAKTLANHRANLKAALRWYAGEAHVPMRGAPLTPDWAELRDAIADRGLKARLYGLMRYASA